MPVAVTAAVVESLSRPGSSVTSTCEGRLPVRLLNPGRLSEQNNSLFTPSDRGARIALAQSGDYRLTRPGAAAAAATAGSRSCQHCKAAAAAAVADVADAAAVADAAVAAAVAAVVAAVASRLV
ncbi:hypothetical protein ElyMa_000781300 [Elysia marginata]|uniref:Uncharacterized protein n=1 Tax=Elysia marginata TaxID=1093978 RepID=A0AAV4GUK1_9GAST|nr:hypothetical protein ElyMa_000781300 [Elysia marginata]